MLPVFRKLHQVDFITDKLHRFIKSLRTLDSLDFNSMQFDEVDDMNVTVQIA